jgi:hypothetical protein
LRTATDNTWSYPEMLMNKSYPNYLDTEADNGETMTDFISMMRCLIVFNRNAEPDIKRTDFGLEFGVSALNDNGRICLA